MTILPIGVVSKKDMGAFMMRSNKQSWRASAPITQPPKRNIEKKETAIPDMKQKSKESRNEVGPPQNNSSANAVSTAEASHGTNIKNITK